MAIFMYSVGKYGLLLLISEIKCWIIKVKHPSLEIYKINKSLMKMTM